MMNNHSIQKGFVIFFIFIFLVSSLFAIVHITKAQEGNYVANEFIVKYKKGVDPQSIKGKVQERAQKKQMFLGMISVLVEDLSFVLNGKSKPEMQLEKMKMIDTKNGIVSKEKLDLSYGALYLMKTDGKRNILEIIETYEKLPEVEYAQPSNIYETQ